MANTTNNSSGLRGPRGIPGIKGLDGDAGSDGSDGIAQISIGQITKDYLPISNKKAVAVTKNGSSLDFVFQVLPPPTASELIGTRDDILNRSWSEQYSRLRMTVLSDGTSSSYYYYTPYVQGYRVNSQATGKWYLASDIIMAGYTQVDSEHYVYSAQNGQILAEIDLSDPFLVRTKVTYSGSYEGMPDEDFYTALIDSSLNAVRWW